MIWWTAPWGLLQTIGRFLGCRGRVVGSQVVCTRAETTLLSGMTTVHRAPLIASLRIPVHHIPANMWHLPAFLLLLLPKLRLVPIVSLFTLWLLRDLLFLGLSGFGFESSLYFPFLLFIHCFSKPYCLCFGGLQKLLILYISLLAALDIKIIFFLLTSPASLVHKALISN